MSDTTLFRATKGNQLSVFLDNEPGSLAEVCTLLGEAGVNMHALTVADGIDHGYLRIVVDDEKKAVDLLEEKGYMAFRREVLMVEIGNTPGTFGAITDAWRKNEININYAYSATGPDVDRAMLIVHVNDIDKAIECLEGIG